MGQGPRLTDSEIIEDAIRRAEDEQRVVHPGEARLIASQLHGGQNSWLYAFASSGHIDVTGLLHELQQFKREAPDEEATPWADSLIAFVLVKTIER